VAAVAKKPVTVVMLTATPLDITDILAHPNVGAVLFGKKPPAGRMVQTIYPKAYADQISIFDFNMRPGPSAWPRPDCKPVGGDFSHCPRGTNPGRTHRFFTGHAVIPFGYGLSYTTWRYEVTGVPVGPVSLAPLRGLIEGAGSSPFLAHAKMIEVAPLVQYEVRVTNTGTVDSDDVVIGFWTPPGAGKDGAPLQTVFAFERVHVRAGESKTVLLHPTAADFTQVDGQGKRRLLAGDYRIRFGVERAAVHGMGFAESLLQTVDGENGPPIETFI